MEGKNIPSDKMRESVAKAMEYCIGDGSAALMAKKMGKQDDYAFGKSGLKITGSILIHQVNSSGGKEKTEHEIPSLILHVLPAHG